MPSANGKSGDGRAEIQKNVPISESYHEELRAIALIDKKTMKEVVEGYIRSDGRGKALLEKARVSENTQSTDQNDSDTTTGTES